MVLRQMRKGALKKLIPILALIPLVILALTPPMFFELDCKINSTFWLWMTFFSGFFAFLFLYQKVSVWLKLFVIWCLVSSFLSRAPFMSLTMSWSMIFCAWYYVLCKQITDWKPIFKATQSIFFLIILLVIMQLFGKDVLLNFGQKAPDVMHGSTPAVFGFIGNRMISSSLMCILAPFLILNPLNWIPLIIISFISWSSSAILAMGVGLFVIAWAKVKKMRILIFIIAILTPILFMWGTGDFKVFGVSGRGPVYLKTIELSVKNPIGFGIGTNKILFPILCGKEIRDQQPGREWSTTHNCFLELLFETGFIGFFLFMGWVVSIVLNVLKQQNYTKLAGLVIIGVIMTFSFPTRIVHCPLIILAFVAYCERRNGLFD